MLISNIILGIMTYYKRDYLISRFLDSNAVHAYVFDEEHGVVPNIGRAFQQGISETFAEPNVKRAMSILQSQGVESRVDNTTREKVADKVMESYPIAQKALEYFNITPIEGLKLMNDPMFAPIIQKAIGQLGGGTTSDRSSSDRNPYLK